MGGAPPVTFASVPYIQNASLPRPETSLEVASVQGSLGIPAVARRLLGLFGLSGGAVRQDVLAATDVSVSSSDEDFAGWGRTVTR